MIYIPDLFNGITITFIINKPQMTSALINALLTTAFNEYYIMEL